MKNGIFILTISLIAILAFESCSDNRKTVELLNKRIDSLEQENSRKDGDIKDVMSFVGVIADGLDSIAQHENTLFYSNKGREGTIVDRDQLKKNLEMFESILANQREKIAQLEDSLKAKGENLGKLSQLIAYLNQQLDEKNSMISNLRAELQNNKVNISHLQKKVANLKDDNNKLNRTISNQAEALKIQSDIINEGYVKIGTKKSLSELRIVSGGFLKKKTVNPNAISKDQYTKVDIRTMNEIPLNSGSPKILTQMPTSSYKIEKKGKNQSTLYILDANAFWSVSNFLIIQL
jgi:chromosome segregation ATPase